MVIASESWLHAVTNCDYLNETKSEALATVMGLDMLKQESPCNCIFELVGRFWYDYVHEYNFLFGLVYGHQTFNVAVIVLNMNMDANTQCKCE